MLKIRADQLRLGMYVHEVCAGPGAGARWRSDFMLDKPEDLERLQSSGATECWVDTTRGLAPHVAFSDELARAQEALDNARPVVESMFREARMGGALKLEGTGTVVNDIVASVSRNAAAFLSLARLKHKDEYTYMHSVAVCGLMTALARRLSLPERHVRSAAQAGLLHDIGKMTIPEEVLNKPGKLSDEEFDQVRQHPARGEDMLRRAHVTDEVVLDVCRHHHERVDGKGYPDRVPPLALSLFARMGAICDVYDALTSNRCYKAGWNPALSIRRMAEWQEGGQFDKSVFHAFVRTVGIYPAGTLVRLRSDRLAIVTEQGETNALTPLVRAVHAIGANQALDETVDLAHADDAIIGIEDPRHWKDIALPEAR